MKVEKCYQLFPFGGLVWPKGISHSRVSHLVLSHSRTLKVNSLFFFFLWAHLAETPWDVKGGKLHYGDLAGPIVNGR